VPTMRRRRALPAPPLPRGGHVDSSTPLTPGQSACRRISVECAITTRVGASHRGVAVLVSKLEVSHEPGPSTELRLSDWRDGRPAAMLDNAVVDHLGSACQPLRSAGRTALDRTFLTSSFAQEWGPQAPRRASGPGQSD
jgi:hypothetical protein